MSSSNNVEIIFYWEHLPTSCLFVCSGHFNTKWTLQRYINFLVPSLFLIDVAPKMWAEHNFLTPSSAWSERAQALNDHKRSCVAYFSYRVFFLNCLFSFLYFAGLNELLWWLIGGKISVCVGHLMDEDWFLKLIRAFEHRK